MEASLSPLSSRAQLSGSAVQMDSSWECLSAERSLLNCRSLSFARDDKREGGCFHLHSALVERTAGPSTSLRSGRDDNSYFGTGGSTQEKCHPDKRVTNSPDDKGEGSASMCIRMLVDLPSFKPQPIRMKAPLSQGPEGRPPNVSPAREGWEMLATLKSAGGAALD